MNTAPFCDHSGKAPPRKCSSDRAAKGTAFSKSPAGSGRVPIRRYSAFSQAARIFAALLFAGCAVGPNYKGPPDTVEPARFKNASSVKGSSTWKEADPKDGVSRGEWWKVFHDPKLNALEAEAISANQDLKLAVARIEEARSQTRLAASDLYPHVDLEPSVIRQRTSNTEPFQKGKLLGKNPFSSGLGGAAGAAGAGPAGAGAMAGGAGAGAQNLNNLVLDTQPLSRTYNVARFPVDLNWELDLFGRVRRNTQAARATAQAYVSDLQNMILSTTANVASEYFQLRALDAELDVLSGTIKTRQEGLQIAQERLQAGLTGELDVARAQSELASNQADVFAVTRTREEVENVIATLLGRPASLLKLEREPLKSEPPSIPAGLPSALLERRPDIATAERQIAAANARIGVATAAFFPRISLTGAAGFESGQIGQLFSWQSRIWQIGANAAQPLFEGGKNTANLEAAHAQYDEAVATYRKQVLVAFQDVETALADLRTLTGQSRAQSEAVTAARRTLELSSSQYEKGAINFLDVLDAERTLLADERTNAELLGQRAQATVQLIKALGGGWN